MNCKKCGSNISESVAFCPYCGEKVESEKIIDNVSENQIIKEENNVNVSNENSIINTTNQVNNNAPINNMQNSNVNSIPTINATSNNQKKKSNAPFIILLVILILIIIGLIIFIVLNLVTNKDDNAAVITDNTQQKEEKIDKEENNTTNVSTSNTITVDGYEFTIPNGYNTAQKSDVYLIMDDEKTAVFELDAVANESLSDYILYAEELKTEFVNKGYVVNGYTTKTVGGIDYLIYDATINGTSMNLYIAKIDEFDIAIGAIIVSPNSTYDNALVKLSNILSTAKGGNNTSSSTFSKRLPSADSNNSFTKKLK